MCLVSVICPVKNGEKYILSHYESIKKNLFFDFEIIYIDNGSDDSSKKIIMDLSCQDSRVVLCNEERPGVSFARNKGVSKASSDVFCFLDVDDILIGEVINKQVDLAINKKIANVCFANNRCAIGGHWPKASPKFRFFYITSLRK